MYKNFKRTLFYFAYLFFLWIFFESASYGIQYYYYYYKADNQGVFNLYKKNLGSLIKHPLIYSTKNIKIEKHIYDAYLSHRYNKNIFNGRLEIDSFGFVHNGDINRKPFNKKDSIKIFTLGGSSVAGAGSSNECTIAAYLERALNNNSDSTYEVINAGQGGYYTPIELTYFIIELVHYKPDYVVSLDGFNDFYHSLNKYSNSSIYKGNTLPQRTRYQQKVEDLVNKQNQLNKSTWFKIENKKFTKVFWFTLRLLSKAYDNYFFNNNKTVQTIWGENSIYIMDNIYKSNSHVLFMEKNWRSLIGAAIANNIKPIILLQPVLPISEKKLSPIEVSKYEKFFRERTNINKDEYEKKIKIFYNELEDMTLRIKSYFADNNNIMIKNIVDIFDSDIENMFFDNVHYTHLGNKKIANFIIKNFFSNVNIMNYEDKVCDSKPLY